MEGIMKNSKGVFGWAITVTKAAVSYGCEKNYCEM
jgi:hypothetical protein